MTASQQGSEGLTSFLKCTPVVKFARRQQIQTSAEFVYLMSGVAMIHYGEKSADLLLSGDFYGEERLFSPQSARPPVETLTECEIMAWRVEHINTVLGSDNGFMWGIARLMHARTEHHRRMLNLAHHFIPQRVAWQLINIVERLEPLGLIEPAEPGVYWMPVWLTHERLARLVGTSREITTACIGQQKKRGEQRRWAVCPEDLRKLLKGEA